MTPRNLTTRKPADRRSLAVIGWTLAALASVTASVAATLVMTEPATDRQFQQSSVERFWPDEKIAR